MVFQPFSTGPLIKGQESGEIDVVVLQEAPTTFVRVAAHLADNELHQGTPPTFMIDAGSGQLTAVRTDAGTVNIPGAGGNIVATATSRRSEELDDDAYLLTIDHLAPSAPKWRMGLRNDEAKTLRFHGFISHTEQETRQPWMEIPGPGPCRLGGEVGLNTDTITVRNLGTATLEIKDLVGSLLNAGDSFSCILKSRPAQLAPHHADRIVVECGPLEEGFGRSETGVHDFSTNDPHPAHSRISFEVVWPVFPATMCLTDEGCFAACREFVPRPPPDECQCGTCFHHAGFHNVECDEGPFPL